MTNIPILIEDGFNFEFTLTKSFNLFCNLDTSQKWRTMKKQLYKSIAKFNKLVLPSFGKKELDMSKAKKWQLAIIGYRAFITKKSL